MERTPIIASEGMILTDGKVYGTEIYLAEGEDKNNFSEITKAEYDEILRLEAQKAGEMI